MRDTGINGSREHRRHSERGPGAAHAHEHSAVPVAPSGKAACVTDHGPNIWSWQSGPGRSLGPALKRGRVSGTSGQLPGQDIGSVTAPDFVGRGMKKT